MFVKREDAIKKASSYLTRALLINTLIVLIPPVYIFFSGPIGIHTYLALLYLILAVTSLLLVFYTRRALEDYSLSSVKAILPIVVPMSFIGGLIVVGLFVNKARIMLQSV